MKSELLWKSNDLLGVVLAKMRERGWCMLSELQCPKQEIEGDKVKMEMTMQITFTHYGKPRSERDFKAALRRLTAEMVKEHIETAKPLKDTGDYWPPLNEK